MFFQQLDSLHHLIERGSPCRFLRYSSWNSCGPSIDTPTKKLFSLKNWHHSSFNRVPLVWIQLSICRPPAYLRCNSKAFFIEADRSHQRLASMPCKQDFLHGLAFHVFLDELLEYLIRHDVILHVRIELTFLKVITILACQITNRTNRFQHDVDRLGERGKYRNYSWYTIRYYISISTRTR